MFKKILDWVGAGSTVYGLVPASWISTYVLPIAAAISAGFAGMLQGVPVIWVIIGAIWAAVGVLAFLIAYLFWKHLGWPEGKLVFCNVRVHRRALASSQGRYELLLGFMLQNKAYFPIEIRISDLRTTLSNTIPSSAPYAKTEFRIEPEQTFFFDDYPIHLPLPPTNSVLTGTIAFKIVFGRPGRLRLKLEKLYTVSIGIDSAGEISGANWIETKVS